MRFRAGSEALTVVEFALALGAYVGTFDWHHFVTLTTTKPAVSDWLRREYHDRFIRRLARHAERRVDHFYAIELDHLTGRFAHLHALVHGTAKLDIEMMRKLWPHGFTDIAPYDRRRHAAHYVVKNLLLDDDSYDWSSRQPPQVVPWNGQVAADFRKSVDVMRAATL